MTKAPVVFDLEPEDGAPSEAPSPAEAPPVPDLSAPRGPAAMERVAAAAARPRSGLAGWFWGALAALGGFAISIAAYDFVMTMIARSPILGAIALGLLGLFGLILLVIVLRELAAFGRLRRLGDLRSKAEQALADGSATQARAVSDKLAALYAGRAELRWGLERLEDHAEEIADADTILGLAEDAVIAPLDALALREVEAAARQVATVTAIVPLALADVATAFTANLRMIRRISEIYGGRAGTLGTWRMTRAVLAHLVATGAVAVGDDLIGTIAGGGVLSKLSRRFGEGVINGALTARVGVAALDVCRPVPYVRHSAPSVTSVVGRALKGLFGSED